MPLTKPSAEAVRKKAIENRNALAEYLAKERFSKFSDEAKGASLQFSLMGVLLYESNLYPMPREHRDECMSICSGGGRFINPNVGKKQASSFNFASLLRHAGYRGSMV